MNKKIYILALCVCSVLSMLKANEKPSISIKIDSVSVIPNETFKSFDLQMYLTILNNSSEIIEYEPHPSIPYSYRGWSLNIYKDGELCDWNRTLLMDNFEEYSKLKAQKSVNEIFRAMLKFLDVSTLSGSFEAELQFASPFKEGEKQEKFFTSNRIQFEIKPSI